MNAITYTLRLVEPLLAARAGAGEENSAVTLAAVPGSSIRGALAARWLNHYRGADLGADRTGRAWFLDGTVCYLNAYPCEQGKRTLPVPASWFTAKNDPDEQRVYDLSAGPDPKLGPLDGPDESFCLTWCDEANEDTMLPEAFAQLVEPLRFDQVHIALKEANRRGKGDKVFRYEALAAEQLFAGAIVAGEDVDLGPIQALLQEGDLFLGSAHRAGYGRVVVESYAVVKDWHEYRSLGPGAADQVVVTLLGEAILRGPNGQVGWDDGEALALALGCRPEARPESIFGRVRLVGGYNRRASLPMIQAGALAAGSVFVFARSAVDMDGLARAVETGIGERRAEGYGRIAIDWHTRYEIVKDRPAERVDLSVPGLSPESKRAAREMVRRRLRLILDRQLAPQVNARFESLRWPLPENAQLSTIRQAVRPGLAGKDLSALKEHLKKIKETGRGQLERCRLGDDTLYAWLRDRADKLDVKEQILSSRKLPVLAGESAELDNALRVEYTARLIDGVMKLAARSKEEQS